MDSEVGAATNESLVSRNRSQNVVIFLLIGLLILSIIANIVLALSGKTILKNSDGSGPTYIVGSTSANKEYYVDFSNYVINYLFNVTPINVSKNFEKILGITCEPSYPQIQKYLSQAEAQIKREGLTSVWSSSGAFNFLEADKAVTIEGSKKTYLADRLVSEKSQKIQTKFVMKKGTICLYSLTEVKDEIAAQ
ncbi:TraE/TraK family type IV conjugative transfer system protein [Acinetobacter seifertii]|uniref:TraE/TraK family type IV conjugative transfer system protein n=1 Tax=Acinetobacter seifertii TaxID=1530123 RepID=UPI000C21C0B4|nr:TraE/TraK family type IV conjugative transfer system protein [Acinetobacter seifertii]PJG65520.1 conjugal transfer protein TraE [Acinetobacter seifertii]